MIAGLLTVGIVMVVLIAVLMADKKLERSAPGGADRSAWKPATGATDATDTKTRNTPGKESQ